MTINRFRNIVIANDEGATKSDFLQFTQRTDNLLQSHSAALTYLRVELARIRPGMADYLIRVSTPKSVSAKPVVVTIRGNKQFSTGAGAERVAVVIARELSTRTSKQHEGKHSTDWDWDKTNVEHLGQMLVNQLKFFSAHHQLTLMRFSTDALA